MKYIVDLCIKHNIYIIILLEIVLIIITYVWNKLYRKNPFLKLNFAIIAQ